MSPYRAAADPRAPDVLICAGLDPSGGAGILADTRVVDMLGGRPCGVVTALTVQNTTGVVDAQPCDPDLVGHQLAFLMTDLEVRAVKLGMLGPAAMARTIANALHLTRAPVVWDPIHAPTRGAIPVLAGGFSDAAISALRPHLTLITPNVHELELLANQPVIDLESATAAARELAARFDTAVLVKGGHLPLDARAEAPSRVVSSEVSIDVLVHPGGVEQLRAPRVPGGEDVHGTGCALASAIATYLALGRELVEACALGQRFVAERLAKPIVPGRGAGAIV
jgi:hydroxymethylpyrimidine kinase/phosphomethylpyrimidine kinase